MGNIGPPRRRYEVLPLDTGPLDARLTEPVLDGTAPRGDRPAGGPDTRRQDRPVHGTDG